MSFDNVGTSTPIQPFMPVQASNMMPTAKPATVERWNWLAESLADTDVSPEVLAVADASRSDRLGLAMAHFLAQGSQPESPGGSCVAYDSAAHTGSNTPPEGWRPTSTLFMPPAPKSTSALETPATMTRSTTLDLDATPTMTRCASLDLDGMDTS